jgi:hypothetical protein
MLTRGNHCSIHKVTGLVRKACWAGVIVVKERGYTVYWITTVSSADKSATVPSWETCPDLPLSSTIQSGR